MLYNLDQLKKENGNKTNGTGRPIESRVSNLEGKINAVLTISVVEFLGFIGLVITLISKI